MAKRFDTGTTETAHDSGNFRPHSEFPAWACSYQTDAFQASDRHIFVPLAFAHVRLRVVQAKRLHLDGGVARFWLGFGEVLEDESFRSTKMVDDNSFHVG